MNLVHRHIPAFIRVAMVAVIAAFALSCIKEKENIIPEPEDGRVRLELYTLPADYTYPATRVMANEDDFDNPMVIAFKGTGPGAEFYEAARSVIEQGKYVVLLTPTDDAVTLLLVTNLPGNAFYDGSAARTFNEENLTEVLKDKTLKQAGEGLLQTVPPTAYEIPMPFVSPVTKLPMSVTHELPGGIQAGQTIGSNTNKLKLIRMVAKATVTVHQNITQNFQLNSIGAGSLEGNGYIYNSGTSVPGTGSSYRYSNFTVGSTTTTTDDPVYLYESPAGKGPFLLLRAQMNGVLYYYPVPFYKDGAYLDIERNKYYKITITEAGIGYANIGEAIAAGASNLPLPGFSSIITVNDEYSYDMVSNEDYFIGTLFSNVELYHNEVQSSILLDAYTDATAAKAITNVISTDGNITATPSFLNYNGRTQIVITVPASVDQGTVTIRLGSLIKKIEVKRYRNMYVPWHGLLELPGTDYISCQVESMGTSDWLAVSPDGIKVTSEGFDSNQPGKIYIKGSENSGAMRTGGQILAGTSSSGRTMIYLSQQAK